MLVSGLLAFKMVAPISKSQRAIISFAVSEQSLIGISILIVQSAII